MNRRITAFILSLLIVMPLMTGCSKTNISESSEDNTGGSNAVSEPVDESPTEQAGIEITEPTASDLIRARYADTDLGGYIYKVLAIPEGGHFYSAGLNEVYAEEMSGDIINDAIFSRNLSAEDTLNIKIEPVWGSDVGGILNQVHNEVLAGSTEYDAVLNRMDYLGSNMQNGDLLNIKSISTVNTEDYWWDKNIVVSFTLFGTKLYWISGDLNIYDDFAAEVIYFNKQLCLDHALEYPYGMVLKGTWTIDRFFEMAKTVEQDLNGDGELKTEDDVVGHCELNDHVKHWIYALGEKSMDIAEDGTLTTRLQEERQIRVVDKLYSLMTEQHMTYTGGLDLLMQNRALFVGTMLGGVGLLRDMESEFGIIPMPKLDEEQENYGEYVSNGWCTAYGIPMTNPDPERTGQILDAICGFSNETLRSALYDTMFSAKYVRDEESVKMLDIIFSSKMYDWAVDFSWGTNFQSLYNGIYNNKQNNFASLAAKFQKTINTTLERLVNTVAGLEY